MFLSRSVSEMDVDMLSLVPGTSELRTDSAISAFGSCAEARGEFDCLHLAYCIEVVNASTRQLFRKSMLWAQLTYSDD